MGLQSGRASASAELVHPGTDRIYEASAYMLSERGEGGAADRYVVMYKDITDRKILERQLIQSEKMAALGLMSGEIAHEINNPVGIILSFSQLALRSVSAQEDETLREFLEQIEDSARRCTSIIRNLLSFARPSRPGERQTLDLRDLTERTLQIVAVPLRSVEVQVDIEDNLPAARGQADLVQQVILNLITNAAHALQSRPRGRRLIIRTRPAQLLRRPAVSYEVEDNGPGLPDEHLSRVFDPFFTTKPEGKGTGLGLSICYRIVSEHGGLLEAENAPGGGALFRMLLPASAEPGDG